MRKRIQTFGHLPVIIAAVLLFAVPVQADISSETPAGAEAVTETDGGSSAAAEESMQVRSADGEKQLTITVVEELPAVEIEEDAVPLAALPNTKTRSRAHATVWVCVLLTAAAAYGIWFGLWERKLRLLRQEAVREEAHLTALRRMRKEQGNM